MVSPPSARIGRDVADLRAEPRANAELVDQAHYSERVRLLGAAAEWYYVQGPDHYFGWLRYADLAALPRRETKIVVVALAAVRQRPERSSPVVGWLPAGTELGVFKRAEEVDDDLPSIATPAADGWHRVGFTVNDSGQDRFGFIAPDEVLSLRAVPSRFPTAGDLLDTADAFRGAPYLWGGTTALGLDCSGFVQQVYRLNGVALPRDANQQAMLGRKVEEARAGDLMFFGDESVTHVALATGSTEFIHAPMKGGVVERGRLGGDRQLRGIRRYLPDVSTV
jgi:cell wall-associated NlpC family hydrolase